MDLASLIVGASGLLGGISRLRLAPRQNAILNDVAPLVLAPFHEIVSRGQEALANAGDSQPMREAAQSLVKEGERAIRKIEPLVKKYITEYDVNFHMALKENDDIAEYRSQLYELLWDLDDYIESAEYFDDHKFSELRAASKEAAIKIYDILGSLKLDAPEEHVLPFAPLPQTTAFPSSNRSTAFSNSVQTGLLEPVWSPVPMITQDSNTYTLEDGTNQPQRLMAFHDDFYQGLEPDPIIQPLPACDPSTVPSNYRYDLNLLLDGNEKAPSAEAASQKGSKVSRGEPDSLIDAAVPFAPTVPWSHSAPSRSLRDIPSRGDKYGYSADTDSRSSLSSSSGFTGSSIKGGHYSAHSSRRGNRASSDYTFASTAISEEDAIHGTYSLTKADIPLSDTSMEVSRGVLPWEKGGLISVAPDYLSGINDPSSLQVQRCFLDAQSSYWLAKGFCDGAKEICGGGVGVKRVKKPTAFMASVTTARCVSCMYELDLSAVENDVNKTERASYSHAGIFFRLRFLQKSHITTKKADDVQYGCVFCVQRGYTLDESDATIFFSYKALMDHIARHPRQGVLPVVPGITVIDEPEVPVSLRNDFDIHFTRPPEPHPAIERRSEISNLPTAVTQNQARRMYGQRALPDKTPALEFPIGARITGLTWPSTYNGEWAMGWYDGVKASVPTDLLRLKPPLSQFEQFGSESRIRAQAKWKFGFEKDKSSDWLRFEKNDVIKNIRWAYFDHWCWSGTNPKGKWGIFPRAFIDLNTLEEPAGLDRALNLSIEKDRPTSDGTYGTYNITVTLRDPPAGDSTSCWNSIAGPAILVQGFPHPVRDNGETGLEITAASMAAIAGIPRAVVFGGGVVFKARCHALVPVEERGDSVQWHLIDKYPEKLEWSDIDELCPHRLKEDFVTEEWWKRRAFLGLAPQFANLLATESYEYEAVTYSSAGRPPRRVQINKISPGFSQRAQLSIEITVGRLDGYRAQRRGDYETLLKDARDIHIILHDTASDRAYQTDGEELILHTILHRWLKNGYDSNNASSPDRPRFPDEHRFVSTRSAMLANAEWPALSRKVFDSSEARVFLFKEEVRTLYSTIEGLRAKFSEPEDSFWRFSLKTGTEVNGWEYMDLVEDRMDMSPKSIDLRNTCGGWDQYAKDIQAVVLFGANLGEVFRPCWSEPSDECQNFRSVPVDCCYLTVQMRTLRDMFRKQGCPDTQETLTESETGSPSGQTRHCKIAESVPFAQDSGWNHCYWQGIAIPPALSGASEQFPESGFTARSLRRLYSEFGRDDRPNSQSGASAECIGMPY
ncbi:hypothetical protein CC79DRAFT_1392006 [Sarocladium strictum]